MCWKDHLIQIILKLRTNVKIYDSFLSMRSTSSTRVGICHCVLFIPRVDRYLGYMYIQLIHHRRLKLHYIFITIY